MSRARAARAAVALGAVLPSRAVTRAACAALVVAAALAALLVAGSESRAGPAAPAVVTVLVDRPSGVPERATGFVAAPGRIVTVAHVLDGGGAVAVQAPGDPRRSARVVRVDRVDDLALLEARSAPAGAAPAAGLRTAAAGSDAGGPRVVTPRGARAVVVRRQIRARVRDSAGPRVYARAALELAGAVTAGDSGAPVLDDGELLGVVFARSRRDDGTAYAVDAAAVERLLAR